MSNKVLCIFAHFDDEMFGVGGTLLKHLQNSDKISFLWFAHGRHAYDGYRKVCEYFQANPDDAIDFYRDQELDSEPIKRFITRIEKKVEVEQPDIIYTNFIGDLNLDHEIIARATMTACRPCRFKGKLLQCWIPGTTEFGWRSFQKDETSKVDKKRKEELLRLFYPQELVNGREVVTDEEYFERWPR